MHIAWPVAALALIASPSRPGVAADQAIPDHTPDRASAYWASKRNSTGWIDFDDYPPSALRSRSQGFVQVRVSVMPDGRAYNCMVVISSNDPVLDEATCRLLVRRGRFYPPTNDAQRSYSYGYNWRIPADWKPR